MKIQGIGGTVIERMAPEITFDGPNKIITIGHTGDPTVVTAVELYSAWKRWVLEGNAQFIPAFAESIGGNEIGGGIKLGYYCFVNNLDGWLITALNEDYTVFILGELYSTDANKTMFTPTVGHTVNVILQRNVGALVVPTEVLASGDSIEDTAKATAQAVWEEKLVDHNTQGTYGEELKPENISAQVWLDAPPIPTPEEIVVELDAPTKEEISDQVWQDAPPIPTAEEISDQVWEDAPPIEADAPSVEDIVAGVWDEEMTTHDKPNSFGKRLRDIFPTLWGIK